MAQLGSWNGYTFEVSSNLIRSFDAMTLKGSCETETKTKNKQKYVKRKNGDLMELTFTVSISTLLGVTDVRGEAVDLVNSANKGNKAYFYYGTKKLVAPKLMLTNAEVTDIEPLPGNPSKWISCDVKVTFKQASTDGSSSSSKKKKTSKKKSAKSSGTKSGGGGSGGNKTLAEKIKTGVKVAGAVIAGAKAVSKVVKAIGSTPAGLKFQQSVIKKVTTSKNTGTQKNATTGRSLLSAGAKLLSSVFKKK